MVKSFNKDASAPKPPSAKARAPGIFLMAADKQNIVELPITDPDQITPYLQKYPLIWLNVVGVDNPELLKKIGDLFNFHALAMEDVANVRERPKIEEYDQAMFGTTQIPQMSNVIVLTQFSFFWGKNYVVSFEESSGIDVIEPLRNKIRHNVKIQNLLTPDYLVYLILDTVIDIYFPVIEDVGSNLDDIEEAVIMNPSTYVMARIHKFKHNLLELRRSMWSQREALRDLIEICNFVDQDIRFSIRDCEDHTIQIIDILESYRDRASGLMDIYLSSISNKMNATIKILTAIATIFMPMTFITGLYGMNFDRTISHWNMPELSWPFGYEYALFLIFGTGLSLAIFFWRRGWFKSGM